MKVFTKSQKKPQKTIFHRALLNELVGNLLIVLTILLGITGSILWIRLLGDAASGALANEAVGAMLGFSILNYLPVLLSVAGFLAVLLTVSRAYRDSEMVVWMSSGLSLTAWIRPVLYLATPIVVIIAVISLVLSPWALRKSDQYRTQLENRDDLSTVAPGVFKESRHADRVYFVESFNTLNNTVNNVFMRSEQNQQSGIMVAEHGYQMTAKNKDRFIVLLNGRRYEGISGQADYKIMEFERYAIRVEAYESKMVETSSKAMRTSELLRKPFPLYISELQWRVSLPISALILMVFAIPLGFSNPRAGRSANLLIAIFAYMIYSNFLSIAQAWVAQGKLNPYIGLWVVHGVMLFLVVWLFHHRVSLFSLFRLLRK